MKTPDGSPSDDDLLAYDRRLLSEAKIAAITRWLEANPEAEERLRLLTEQRPNPTAEALRQPSALTEELVQLSGVTERVVDRLMQQVDRRADTAVSLGTIRDYQLIKELGRGGMGRVFLAIHKRLHRNVALKLLAPELAADPKYRVRFERETAALGQMDHPNLVRAFDAGAEGQHLFLVMELLDGNDLKALVAKGGPWRIADACEVIRQAALGLHYAHERGMVHRDVKPGNLFLTSAGAVKVFDLGVARIADTNPESNRISTISTILGTPDFMAPEQWDNTAVDRRADIYSLGCTLYCLLIGEPPFAPEGKDAWIRLFDAHRETPAPLAHERRPETPMELSRLLSRMLAKKPADRPATAGEVAAALMPFTAGHSLQSLPATDRQTPTEKPPAKAAAPKRWKRLAVAAAALGTVVVASVFVRQIEWRGARSTSSASNREGTEGAVRPDKAALSVILAPSRSLKQHNGGVMAVAFSPDGKVLASGGQDRAMYLWDTKTWTARGPLGKYAGDVIGFAFSPDGSNLASVTSSRDICAIRLWNVAEGQLWKSLGGQSEGIWGVAYSPSGETIACAGWDRSLHIWSVANGQEARNIPNVATRHVRALAYSPNGNLIATGGSGPTRLWDANTGEEIPTRLPSEMCPTFLSLAELAGWSFGIGGVTICQLPSGKIRASWRAHPQLIEGMAVSPDGRFIATVGREGYAYVWSADDQTKIATLKGHAGSVYSASFRPDGTQLVTAGMDDFTIHVWDLPPICHVRK